MNKGTHMSVLRIGFELVSERSET